MTSVSHLPQVRIRRGPPGRERSRKRLVVSYCSKPGPVVVGVGGVGIDYLASVLTFPKPDQKLRTERLEAQGGGNCGNCLTAAARLGLECRVVSTVGNDSLGDSVVAEFEADGVHTQFLKRQEGAATPFTYIIVDEAGGTRTCIHTPGAALRPSDITPEFCNSLLEDASLVYFDGRLTEAALVVAHAAKQANIPILVEAERLRPDLDMLMAPADYLVTSRNFPEDWTGEESIGDAMLATMLRLPGIQWMVTTFGKKGAALLRRVDADAATAAATGEPQMLQPVLDSMFAELDEMPPPAHGTAPPAYTTRTGVAVFPGHVVKTERPVTLQFDRKASKEKEALERALMAARREAAANADLSNPEAYMADAGGSSSEDDGDRLSSDALHRITAEVYVCSAAPMEAAEIVDTTGAGDAFIASVIYGLVQAKSFEDTMRLGTVVAASKCTQLGARPGLPLRDGISAQLL